MSATQHWAPDGARRLVEFGIYKHLVPPGPGMFRAATNCHYQSARVFWWDVDFKVLAAARPHVYSLDPPSIRAPEERHVRDSTLGS